MKEYFVAAFGLLVFVSVFLVFNFEAAMAAGGEQNGSFQVGDLFLNLNSSYSPSIAWWNDTVNVSGYAVWSNGLAFNASNGTIQINQTSGSGDIQICDVVAHNMTGAYSCSYRAPLELGDYNLTVHAVNVTGLVVASLSGNLPVRPTYGSEPSGSSPRAVIEIPVVAQEPSGGINIVLTRFTVS